MFSDQSCVRPVWNQVVLHGSSWKAVARRLKQALIELKQCMEPWVSCFYFQYWICVKLWIKQNSPLRENVRFSEQWLVLCNRAIKGTFSTTAAAAAGSSVKSATNTDDVVEKSQPKNNSASGDTRWPAELRASAKFKIRNYRFFWVSEFHKVLQHLNTFI